MPLTGPSQNFPALDVPFTDEDGLLTQSGRSFLEALFNRTGAGAGVSSDKVATLAADADTKANAAIIGANASLKKLSNLVDLTNAATARNNLGLGPIAISATVTGWTAPTGAGSRATFDMNWTTAVGAAYAQVEVTAIRDQLIVVQKRLGQLIVDQTTVKTIGV